MKKAATVVIVLALAGLLGWRIYVKAAAAGNGQGDSGRGRRGGAVPVEVAPVEKATVADVASFTGSLLPRSYFLVAPKVAGRLEKLMVNIGDPVGQGQLVAVIDDDEYTQQVQVAQAELLVAQANVEEAENALELGKREYERIGALREKRIASESEFDGAGARYQAQDARLKVARAQVAQKQAALKVSQVRLSYTRITVSWEKEDGRRVVGERFVDEGAMLRANEAIVSILDISTLIAAVHVTERDYTKIAVGQSVVVTTDAYPGRTFPGKVLRVAPLLKETSRQARVEVEMPNPETLLKPGLFVVALLEFGRRENATVVPVSALVRREGGQAVFLADPQAERAALVPVTVGIVSEDRAEIVDPALSGLVVTLGQHLLSDGAAITLGERAPAGAGRGDAETRDGAAARQSGGSGDGQ